MQGVTGHPLSLGVSGSLTVTQQGVYFATLRGAALVSLVACLVARVAAGCWRSTRPGRWPGGVNAGVLAGPLPSALRLRRRAFGRPLLQALSCALGTRDEGKAFKFSHEFS